MPLLSRKTVFCAAVFLISCAIIKAEMLRGDIYAVKSSITSALWPTGNFPAEPSALPCPLCGQTSPELPLTVRLDGEWNFRYAENLTAPFTDWDTLTVPASSRCRACKSRPAYGAPHYVNTQYPWDGHEKLHPVRFRRTITHRGVSAQLYPAGKLGQLLPAPERCDSAAAVLVQWRLHRLHRGYLYPAEFDMTAASTRRKYPDGTGVPFLLRQLAGGSGFWA